MKLLSCPSTQYAASSSDSNTTSSLRRSKSSLAASPLCFKVGFEFEANEDREKKVSLKRNDLMCTVGPASLTIHWPALKFATEIMASIGDLIEISYQPDANDIEEELEAIEVEQIEREKGKEKEGSVPLSRQSVALAAAEVSPMWTMPSVSFELQGLEIVIPTYDNKFLPRAEKNCFIFEIRNGIFSYSNSDDSVTKVKAILSRITLNEYFTKSRPVHPAVSQLSLLTKRGLPPTNGDILFDRSLPNFKKCTRPILKPFDLTATACVSFVGASSSTTGKAYVDSQLTLVVNIELSPSISIAVGPQMVKGVSNFLCILDNIEHLEISPRFQSVRLPDELKLMENLLQVPTASPLPSTPANYQPGAPVKSSSIHLVELIFNLPLLSVALYKEAGDRDDLLQLTCRFAFLSINSTSETVQAKFSVSEVRCSSPIEDHDVLWTWNGDHEKARLFEPEVIETDPLDNIEVDRDNFLSLDATVEVIVISGSLLIC